jgi:predicted dienelactone hydrolase
VLLPFVAQAVPALGNADPLSSFLANLPAIPPSTSSELINDLAKYASSFIIGGNISYDIFGSPAPSTPLIKTINPLGPYKVGIRMASYPFEDRELKVSWWYPAKPAPFSKGYIASGGVQGMAVEDAPLDTSGGKYPLIVFSPGLGAVDDSYYFYVQNLASSGYIVLSIRHSEHGLTLGTNSLALSRGIEYAFAHDPSLAVFIMFTDWFRETQFGLTYRPQEIKFLLDLALEQSATNKDFPFYNMIDADRIGMSGHSLGAAYSLLIGSGMAIYCDRPLSEAESDLNNPTITDINPCAMPQGKALSNPKELHDPRIKAVIPLAAPYFIKDVERGSAAINTPTMMLLGDDPLLESSRWPQRATYDNAASSKKYWVEILGTNHFLVSDLVGANPVSGLITPSYQSGHFNEKAKVYMQYSSAFYDLILKGDESSLDVLHNPASRFVVRLNYQD